VFAKAGYTNCPTLDFTYLRLVGRGKKTMLRDARVSQTDKFVEDWIQKTHRNRSDYDHYAQTDPDLYALWKDFSKYDKPQPNVDEDSFAEACEFMHKAFFDFCPILASGLMSKLWVFHLGTMKPALVIPGISP